MNIEWTTEDAWAASREGWDVFECWGSQNGPWQIQKFDDGDPNPLGFVEDEDAWVHVRTKAAEALTFLWVNNPQEIEAIRRFVPA